MLSSTSEYALRIMITLTEAGGQSLTSEQIAGATRVPPDYTIKVLQLLGRSKLVRAQRGRGGGFQLICDPATTTLLDVVNVIDPLERIRACPLGREAHQDSLCPFHKRIDEVIAMLASSLDGMTLAGVVQGSPGPTLCPVPATEIAARPARKKRPIARRASAARPSGRRAR